MWPAPRGIAPPLTASAGSEMRPRCGAGHSEVQHRELPPGPARSRPQCLDGGLVGPSSFARTRPPTPAMHCHDVPGNGRRPVANDGSHSPPECSGRLPPSAQRGVSRRGGPGRCCRSASGSAPTAAGTRSAATRRSVCSAAVLALLVRTESALVAVARLEAGKPAVEDTVAVAAPRASGLRAGAPGARLLPVLPRLRGDGVTLLALAAAIVDALADGSPGTRALMIALVPIAAITAVGHLVAILASEPPAMTFGCVVLTMGRRPRGPAARARLAARPARGRARRRGRRQRAGSRPGCRRACAASARAENWASRRGATSACRTRAASCCSSSTTTPRSPRPTRSPAVARRFEADPKLGAAAAAGRPARRRRVGARLGAAAARRRPGALERHHRGVGGRGRDAACGLRARRAAGRRTSASCTRASTSAGA